MQVTWTMDSSIMLVLLGLRIGPGKQRRRRNSETTTNSMTSHGSSHTLLWPGLPTLGAVQSLASWALPVWLLKSCVFLTVMLSLHTSASEAQVIDCLVDIFLVLSGFGLSISPWL